MRGSVADLVDGLNERNAVVILIAAPTATNPRTELRITPEVSVWYAPAADPQEDAPVVITKNGKQFATGLNWTIEEVVRQVKWARAKWREVKS